jgi:hypothetical protein
MLVKNLSQIINGNIGVYLTFLNRNVKKIRDVIILLPLIFINGINMQVIYKRIS